MDTKQCTKCGGFKPPAGFHRCSENRDGLARWCRDCFRTFHALKAAKRKAAKKETLCSDCRTGLGEVRRQGTLCGQCRKLRRRAASSRYAAKTRSKKAATQRMRWKMMTPSERERLRAIRRAKYQINPEPHRARSRAYKKRHPGLNAVRNARWTRNNPQKAAEINRRSYQKRRDLISDSYLRTLIFSKSQIRFPLPPGFAEAKRSQLQITRHLKQMHLCQNQAT